MLSTLNKAPTLSTAEKKERIKVLRLYHTALLQQYNVPDADFTVKSKFTNNSAHVIGVFPSEFKKAGGLYFEFVDKELSPVDPERKVWKLNPVENYEHTYMLLQSGSYAVPIDELEEVVVKRVHQPLPEFNLSSISPGEKTDDHFSKMTIRDLAAILWQEPVSDKDWLNSLVIETKQQQQVI